MSDASPMYVVGAGGLGGEVFDALLALGRTARDVVFLDDYPRVTVSHGVPVLHPDNGVVTGSPYVVAVSDPSFRRILAKRMDERGLVPYPVVHPRATIAHDAVVPDGCVVLANAFVSTGARLGSHTQVHYNATVGHDTVVGRFGTVLPGANVAGNVVLGPDVTVGSNACVLQGLEIGERTTVGAGAVVTRSHPPDQVLVGVPARQCSRLYREVSL